MKKLKHNKRFRMSQCSRRKEHKWRHIRGQESQCQNGRIQYTFGKGTLLCTNSVLGYFGLNLFLLLCTLIRKLDCTVLYYVRACIKLSVVVFPTNFELFDDGLLLSLTLDSIDFNWVLNQFSLLSFSFRLKNNEG